MYELYKKAMEDLVMTPDEWRREFLDRDWEDYPADPDNPCGYIVQEVYSSFFMTRGELLLLGGVIDHILNHSFQRMRETFPEAWKPYKLVELTLERMYVEGDWCDEDFYVKLEFRLEMEN